MCENSGIPPDKSALRAWARQRRSETDFVTASRDVVGHIAALPAFRAARNVLIYLALPTEPNVERLIACSEGSTKTWYVPRCEKDRQLSIHRFDQERSVLRNGPFGIREPGPSSEPLVDLSLIELVLVPGLLFTPQGVRLGNGGGYYDRFLPLLSPNCVRIGVIPRRQLVNELPVDSWDICVSQVVTELGVVEAESIV